MRVIITCLCLTLAGCVTTRVCQERVDDAVRNGNVQRIEDVQKIKAENREKDERLRKFNQLNADGSLKNKQ